MSVCMCGGVLVYWRGLWRIFAFGVCDVLTSPRAAPITLLSLSPANDRYFAPQHVTKVLVKLEEEAGKLDKKDKKIRELAKKLDEAKRGQMEIACGIKTYKVSPPHGSGGPV